MEARNQFYLCVGPNALSAGQNIVDQFDIKMEELSVQQSIVIDDKLAKVIDKSFGYIWLKPYDSWEELTKIRQLKEVNNAGNHQEN